MRRLSEEEDAANIAPFATVVHDALADVGREPALVRVEMTDQVLSYVVALGEPLALVVSRGAEVVHGGLLVYAPRVRLAPVHVTLALTRQCCGNTLILASGAVRCSMTANGGPERARRRIGQLVRGAPGLFAEGVRSPEIADRNGVADGATELRALMRRARLPVGLVRDVVDALTNEAHVTTFTIVQAITWAAQRNEPEVRWELERLAGAYLEKATMATSRDERLTEPERARALARFRCLLGRAVSIETVPYGPIIEAATPEQLRDGSVHWRERADGDL
jgi:hypothetical protein